MCKFFLKQFQFYINSEKKTKYYFLYLSIVFICPKKIYEKRSHSFTNWSIFIFL